MFVFVRLKMLVGNQNSQDSKNSSGNGFNQVDKQTDVQK